MSRLVDPTICPDCRAPLDAAATCIGCGLRISGPLASELWSVMVRADALVERLARFNLRWVHCGHWHGESVRPSKGIPLSTSRCCARIRGNRDGSPLKGWHIYRAAPDGTLTRRFVALPSSI